MEYDLEIHHRRSIRLKGFDYSQNGAYFITLCTQNRECLFGEIKDGEMNLNDAGKMVQKWWLELPNKFSNIMSDEYVVMPNHLHGIITVGASLVGAQKDKRAGTRPAPTFGDIVGAFKSLTLNEYIRNVRTGKFSPFEKSIWQRNYYEHIIRDDDDLNHIREYIINNPIDWNNDDLFTNSP